MDEQQYAHIRESLSEIFKRLREVELTGERILTGQKSSHELIDQMILSIREIRSGLNDHEDDDREEFAKISILVDRLTQNEGRRQAWNGMTITALLGMVALVFDRLVDFIFRR